MTGGWQNTDALVMLRANDELLENLNLIMLVDAEGRLTAAVHLARLFLPVNGRFDVRFDILFRLAHKRMYNM